MARHIADRPRHRAGQSLSQFLRVARMQAVAGPRFQAMRRVPRPLNNAARLRRYLQIARVAN
ncbi:MAG: hypothetical protein AAFY90_02430 [Pseudomonadota bacterium]